MRELQSKVKEREEQITELASKLQEHQAAYLEQHARDRAEIEALSNKLFESGAASIAGGWQGVELGGLQTTAANSHDA